MAKSNSRDRKNYYGWVVVATCFIILAIMSGIQLSFGIFFKPVQEAFGWSRATISWAMTIHLIVFALCMVPAGWAIDRFKTRPLFSIAALLVGVSLVLSSRISQPWQLYLVYGLLLGITLSIYFPVMPIIMRWFPQKRGVALGITGAGVGFGTLVGAPLSNALIVSYGWRNSFTILGIATCIILLVCTYFFRTSPQTVTNNQGKLANTKTGNNNQALKPTGMTFRQAVKTREMLLILVTHVFVGFTIRTIMAHIAPYATDVGISPSFAALVVGIIGGSSVLGRLVMGFVQDKIGAQRSLIICLSVEGLSLLALPFLRSDLVFIIYAAVFGFTYGGDMPQIPAITAQCFGMASIATVYGLVQTMSSLAGAIGVIIAGYVFDLTGSYTIVFWGAAAGLFTGVFCISRLRLGDQRRQVVSKTVSE